MMFGPGPGGPLAYHGMRVLYGGGSIFMMGFGLLLTIGFVVLLVMLLRPGAFGGAGHAAAATTVFSHHQPPVAPPRQDAAEEIARERFARGEIDNVEFDRIVAALRSR